MKRSLFVVFLSCLTITNSGIAGGITEEVGKKLPSLGDLPVKSIEQAKQEELDALKEEKKQLEEKWGTEEKKRASDIEEVKNQLAEVKNNLVRSPNNEFFLKKQELLAKKRDLLVDIQRAQEGVLKKVSNHITLLEKYFKQDTKPDIKIEARLYTFEGLEEVNQKVINQKKHVDQLKKREEAVSKEIKSLKQVVETQEQEYKKAQKNQEQFAKVAGEQKRPAEFGMTVQQRGELLDNIVEVAQIEKRRAELQLEEKQRELALLEAELFNEKKRLTSLEELLQNIKPSIVVTGEQIERAKNAAENKRKALLTKKNRYDEMLSKVKQERENKRATARQISEQYGVPLELELYEWEWSPKKTFEAYAGTCLLSSLVAQISLLNSQENKIERTRALEQRKVDYLEELAEVKETYFKLVERKFVSQDAITQEIKKYSDKKSEYEAEIKNLQLRKDEINALVMRLQTEVLEQLRKLRENVREQRTILFKGKGQEFSQCLLSIDKAQEVVKNRIDVLETISKTYTESIGVVSKLVNHLNFILGELATSTIWYRPGDAISWTGIKNIPQDIELFFTDLRSYLYQFSFTTFFARLAAPFVQADFLWLLLQSIILLLALVIVRLFVLPVMMTSLLAIAQRHGGLLQWMLFFLVMLASFILRNFLRIFIWLVPFIIIKAYPIPDPYFYILFYLASIPYLLYIARRFIAYFQLFNTQYDYALLSEEFQDRFLSIFSTVIYAVLVLLFFRQAFLRANYQKSELPNIVLAIMLFIIQLALILLPSKEQIVSIIPTQPEAWQWVRFQVNRFYYIMLLFMITIIIMSNTYVGYSNLVLYILSQLFYTLILIRVLFWAHGLIKRWASQIFFSYTPEDIARDRFPHSKTWFGFVIIFSFIVLGFLGAAIGAKIWGGALTFFEVKSWLTEPILGRGTNISISSLDLAQIVAFIVSGFLLAFAFNRFVLQKIFDLMLVDTGLQHAITSITRYIIVAVAILIGLQSVRLGDIVTWAYAALIFGIGYMIKDPAGDLIAYFVILMQRPIKIGDYIWIDDKTMGVVRKITPKSIILRRKNSVTLIVPNRVIISQPVYNWNYTRNFVAFDDIFITIPFRYDPAFAKRLFEEVVDNHAMILKSPKPIIRLDAYGDYGYKFMVRGFVSAAASLQVWQVASDIRIAIVARLKKEGVAIAVPVRVVLKENEFLAQEREEKSSERE